MKRAELITEVINSYGSTARLLKTYLHEGNSYPEIGLSQLQLLFCIESCKPAPTQKVVADYMHITPGALTQLVEPLVDSGYVIRHADAIDRRRVRLEISATGQDTLRAIKADRAKLFAKLLETLTDEELTIMLKAQQKMFSVLENDYLVGRRITSQKKGKV